MWINLLVVCGVLISAQAANVKLTIYYETLCPDSKRFVSTQLYPTWKQFSEVVDVQFVPFGKADYIVDHFVCQHGELECDGNRLQSCAIDILEEQADQVEFVNCIMSTSYTTTTGAECASALDIDFSPIEECFNSDRSVDLLISNGNLTKNLSPPLIEVPSVAVNDVFDYDVSNNAVQDLASVLEQFFKNYIRKLPSLKLTPISMKIINKNVENGDDENPLSIATETTENEPTTTGGPTENAPTTTGGPTENAPTTTGGPTENAPTTTGGPTENAPTTTGGPTENVPTTTGGPTENVPTTTGGPTENVPTTTGGPTENEPTTTGGPTGNEPTTTGGPTGSGPTLSTPTPTPDGSYAITSSILVISFAYVLQLIL